MFAVAKLPLRLKILCLGTLLLLAEKSFGLSSTVQLVFFALGIALIGIPHGSLDHFLYLKSRGEESQWRSMFRFLFFYLGYGLLYAVLWYLNPALSILLFILISAYHFGEMDLFEILNKGRTIDKIMSTCFGLIFLANYLLFKWPEAKAILSSFPGFELHFSDYITIAYEQRFLWLAISLCLIGGFFLFHFLKNQLRTSSWMGQLLPLVLLWLIVFNLPLLLGFGFYFSCWHAGLSITEIRKSLGWEHQSWLFLFKKSLPTNLAAFIMIASLLFFFYGDLNRILAILFMSIAILTAPHVQVISAIFSGKKAF